MKNKQSSIRKKIEFITKKHIDKNKIVDWVVNTNWAPDILYLVRDIAEKTSD